MTLTEKADLRPLPCHPATPQIQAESPLRGNEFPSGCSPIVLMRLQVDLWWVPMGPGATVSHVLKNRKSPHLNSYRPVSLKEHKPRYVA